MSHCPLLQKDIHQLYLEVEKEIRPWVESKLSEIPLALGGNFVERKLSWQVVTYYKKHAGHEILDEIFRLMKQKLLELQKKDD